MSDTLQLDPQHTALVLIDMQKGVLQRSTAPHSAAEAHTVACTTIFPRLGRVRTTQNIPDALTSDTSD